MEWKDWFREVLQSDRTQLDGRGPIDSSALRLKEKVMLCWILQKDLNSEVELGVTRKPCKVQVI